MNYLSPSILAADFSNLWHDIKLATDNGAEYIHIDIMDGVFVPNISFGFPVIDCLRPLCDKVFDVHLMIDKPERYVEKFVNSGADIITFHIESTNKPFEIIKKVHSFGKRVGLSIKPNTTVESIAEFLPYIDMVLVMTVEPGFGGQKFMPEMLNKVEKLKAIKQQNSYHFDIEADGGITLENIDLLKKAGVNVFVAGSSVFAKEKIAENTRKFIDKII